jgi:hypothetical protein
VRIDDIDGVNDHGVDIILKGISSGLGVGFQIKSDGDLRAKDFTIKLKGQITDSRKYALELLVIVFACRPTPENRQKYAYLQAEFAGYDEIQIIDPMRAAGLLRVFDSPIPLLCPASKSWQDLFVSTKQLDIAPMYLDHWWGLDPDERFQPPKEFKNILECVDSCPLTIVSGPPAVGKTFTALQVIWRKFGEGRDVSWIGPPRLRPPEGLISDSDTMPDLRERIDEITRKLAPTHRPLKDVHDFISSQLDFNQVVYIEDPFGKTNQEFAYSLHTYEFFDLNRFVSSISKGTPRYGCHILITTRDGLFDRWIDDCKRSRIQLPEFKLIRLAAASYTYKQRGSLVHALAVARRMHDPDKITALLTPHIRVPLDAERIMRELPQGATYELIVERASEFNGDFQAMLNSRILADSDAERLFLFLLATLSSGGSPRYDFNACYKNMHHVLMGSDELKGEGVTTWTEIPRLISSWSSLSERAKSEALGYLSEHEDHVIEQFCGSLEYSDISSDDAWDFLRLLIPKPYIGTRKSNVFGNPWGYLSRHLDRVPVDLRDALDRRAGAEPVLFSYALSDVLVNSWEAAPSSWRQAFSNPECLSNPDLQEKVLMDISRHWNLASGELRKLFDQQSRHKDYRIRAASGIGALVHYDSSPESLQPIVMSSVQDSDIRVPLLVMRGGLGTDDHDRKFAQALFMRADATAASYILVLLIRGRDLKETTWKVELARQCITKGEEFSQAVLLFNHFSHEREQTQYLNYCPPHFPMNESEPVRLAWLWVYANQQKSERDLTGGQAIDLLDTFAYPYRQLALFNLSVQANHLPKQLQRYLSRLQTSSDQDREAIQRGKEQQEPAGKYRTLSFPTWQLIQHTS